MYKLFIVAPHFPPSSLPPAQRIRLMVKHTGSLGFQTTVFTTHEKYREDKNDVWLTELAGNDFELITLKSLNQKITRKFKFGDLGLRFIPFLFFRLIRECRKQKPDFIIYPVPPWYLLTIAPIVKKLTGVKYAIDFIDPWVVDDYKHKIGIKKKMSQWIARRLERWVTVNASFIYAVSEQINIDLMNRHSSLKEHVFKAIPYGVEISDFQIPLPKKANEELTFNYIGAVWPAALPVVKTILLAFKEVADKTKIKVNFTGTSYAGKLLAKKSLDNFIDEFELKDVVTEDPHRVTYKKAIELSMNSDILFLFGDTSKQYAASKLMGLIASQKPFFAVLHKNSFPYQFLKSLNYKYLVGYSDNEDEVPSKKKDSLVLLISELINDIGTFEPISLNDEKFRLHTANNMTNNILNPIKKIIEDGKSLGKN